MDETGTRHSLLSFHQEMNTQCKMNPNAFYGSTIHSFKALSGHWKHNNDKIKNQVSTLLKLTFYWKEIEMRLVQPEGAVAGDDAGQSAGS